MDKSRDLRLTEVDQDAAIQQNTNNIASLGTNVDINTTDISDIKTYLSIAGDEAVPITREELGHLEDLTTTDKTNIVAAINELDAELTSNLETDEQNSNRLTIIENALAVKTSDYAIFKGTGTVDSTGFQDLEETLLKDFSSDQLADFDEETGLVQVKSKATVTTNFHFSANQLSGDKVVVIVELYNVTKATVIDTALVDLDFSGAISQTSGSRFNKGDVDAGDYLDVRVRMQTAGNTITITDSALDYEVAAIQGELDSVYDYNVVSTNTTLGNLNVAADINNLVVKDTEQAGLITNNTTAIGTNTTAIAALEPRVSANENAILALQQFDNGVQGMINTMADMLTPVGTIQLGVSAPTYGTWEDLGLLQEGQAIIGGSSSDGEAKRAKWATGSYTAQSTDQSSKHFLRGITTFDSTGASLQYGSVEGASVGELYTNGGSYNKAYGLGIGLDIHVWKRTA